MNAHLPTVIITIDGPAGTGKSTVAHGLASRLGLEVLDTGAMYRAASLLALRQSVEPDDGPALARALREAHLHFNWQVSPPQIMIGDDDVSDDVRSMNVSRIVSIVAAQPEVRRVLVEHQRRIAREHRRLVTEGRDQGSVVFPDACVRFYLHADVNVRAKRRTAQLVGQGREVDHSEIVADITQRDRLDASRTDAPLIRPRGAVDIDSGSCSADEVITTMESVVRAELGDGGFQL